MYAAHGAPGFWLRRTTWDKTCARVVGIGELAGPPPYYSNPPVLADVYTLDGCLKEELTRLPAAGTYKTWRQIEPPVWASRSPLRSLDDANLAAALARHDRRNSGRGDNREERVELIVPYARKDEAKAIGAHWNPAIKIWWIASNNAAALAKAARLGFLPV
jgi:hypothetical protein